MKILFDNQVFNNQQFGGISRYFAELMHGISNDPLHRLMPEKLYSTNFYLSDKNLLKNQFFFNYPTFRGKARINSFLVDKQNKLITSLISKGDYDIFHPTYYDSKFLENLHNKPFVLTVHDMIHELYLDTEYNKIHSETLNKQLLIPKASHIIAVSQNTKNDILKLYPEISPEKISVIHHGNSLRVNNNVIQMELPEKYLLFVGQRDAYKNFNWMIDTLKDYLTDTNISVICAGGSKFKLDEIEILNHLGLANKVIQIPIDADHTLAHLYQNAVCFVYPSKYEGFGIPILEAFACQCPVIISNSSCFPEIAGDAALYFNLEKPFELLENLRIVQETEQRNVLIAKGNNQLKKFSWQKSVYQHLAVYNKLR
ncbi:MAG: glycosyltransferase family 1 protein [Bacteroidota bacterium]